MAVITKRNEMPVQEAKIRAHNFNEVALGYNSEMAINEAQRCLNCKNKPWRTELFANRMLTFDLYFSLFFTHIKTPSHLKY